MPKKVIEISNFNSGIVSSASQTDIPENSAKYSNNIDSITTQGRLEGINKDKVLTAAGFKTVTTAQIAASTTLSLNFAEFTTYADKTDTSKVNLIGIEPTSTNAAQKIISIEDVYNPQTTSAQTLLDNISSVANEFSLLVNDNKVHVGLGTGSSNSKVVMKADSNPLKSVNNTATSVYEAALDSINIESLSTQFSHFHIPIMHGYTADEIIDTNDMYLAYDIAVNMAGGDTLYTALNTGTYGTSGSLNGLKVGQIFKINSTQDTSNNELQTWKRYDYDATATIETRDLFMFCGYIQNETTGGDVPVLKFLGNLEDQGGIPAFAYGIKDGDSKIYQISLTTPAATLSAAEFDTSVNGDIVDSTGSNYNVANIGERITSVDVSSVLGAEGSITSLTTASSPTLFNSIGLVGEGESYGSAQNVYTTNGHLDTYYRYGVFWFASSNSTSQIYRINAIDFHNLTPDGVQIESLNLDFTNIPSKLEAEDGDGIVRRTLEDQAHSPPEDPKRQGWSRIPENAEIIGLCETFESGRIRSIDNKSDDYTGLTGVYEFSAKGRVQHSSTDMADIPFSHETWRLTSGDVVRFAGMSTTASENTAFNQGPQIEVNVIKDGGSFITKVSDAAAYTPALNSTTTRGYNLWWNSKLWIMYGKKSDTDGFENWDLFLYNANTIDMTSNRALKMADRTVPYHQARYYTSNANSVNQKGQERDNVGNKIYYPGQFAFIHKIDVSGVDEDGDEDEAPWIPSNFTSDNFVSPKTDITCTDEGDNSNLHFVSNFNATDGLGNITLEHVIDEYTGFGIYNKQGKWARNGKFGTKDDIERGAQPDDNVYGADAYYDPLLSTTNYDSGPMSWGENIGWDIDEPRKIKTVQNSLVPKVKHSSSYMANEIYISRYTGEDDKIPANVDRYDIAETVSTYNNPMHSVTFLGFTSGKFVVRPQRISRRYTEKAQSAHALAAQEQGSNDFSVNTPIDSLGFASHHVAIQDVQEYSNSLTLYTIDDFSGHRGSVKYGNDNATNLTLSNTSQYVSGVEQYRPNFGGPEIENPNHTLEDGNLKYPLSSVNNGYGDTSANSKGWDGYTPPYLFNPGKGYYVYINRSWKCQTLDMPALSAHNLEISEGGTLINPLPNNLTWNFNSDGDNGQNKINSNNAHNFSSTCIADCETTGTLANNSNWPYETNKNYRFWRGNDDTFWKETRFGFMFEDEDADIEPEYRRTFGSENEYNSVGVCTFNKIITSEAIDKVNNAFITTFKSRDNNTIGTANNFDYATSYICGVRQSNNNGSGLLIIRNSLDSVYDRFLRQPTFFSTQRDLTIDPWEISTTNDWNQNVYSQFTEYVSLITAFEDKAPFDNAPSGEGSALAFRNTGTNNLEVVNLITDTSKYFSEPAVNASSHLGMRQIAFYAFDNTIIGDDLVVLTPQPDDPYFRTNTGISSSDELDFIVSVSSLLEDSIYIGHKNEMFEIDNEGYSSLNEGYYAEDMGGGGGSGGWDAALNQFFTATDNSYIWEKSAKFIDFSQVGSSGLDADTYHYKFAYEYDGQYESPLNDGFSSPYTVTGSGAEYIRLKLTFKEARIEALSQRITGISIYRRQAGEVNTEDTSYYLVKNVPFSDSGWYLTPDGYSYNVEDKGELGPSYEAINGLPQTISDASLNYGLSTSYQGYMFVSNAKHNDLKDVQRYIFRSQPDNYFIFDYTKDFVIMPEVPVAMTSFNSRLYIWGKNKLYKVDPFSLIIEDEYEGIGIAGKNAYVKTEFGLCFLDKNNVYIHDGNRPNPIASSILYSTANTIDYEIDDTGTDGYYLLQQGYRDLIQQTIDNGDDPNVFYLGRKNSFVVNLSNKAKEGKCFVFNLDQKRWDLWDAPRPKSVNSSQNSDILINDGTNLFNYIDSESELYGSYNKRPWSWFSKDLTIGANNIDKIFRGFTFLGTPCIYDYSTMLDDFHKIALPYNTTDGKTNSIQVFIDGEQVIPIIKNTMYETVNLGNVRIVSDDEFTALNSGTYPVQINAEQSYLMIHSNIGDKDVVGGGISNTATSRRHQFIRPGHLIKVGDEIILVTEINVAPSAFATYATILQVQRGQMGTTATAHSLNATNKVQIVSPRFKMPARSRGKHMSIRLLNQAGYVDAISISYKLRSVKF